MAKRVMTVRAGEKRSVQGRFAVVYGPDADEVNTTARELYRRGVSVRVFLGEKLPELPMDLLWLASEPYLPWRARYATVEWRDIVRDYFQHCVSRENFSDGWARLEVLRALSEFGKRKQDLEKYMAFLKTIRRVYPKEKRRGKWRR